MVFLLFSFLCEREREAETQVLRLFFIDFERLDKDL